MHPHNQNVHLILPIFYAMLMLSDPQVSPDGKWCTYTVTTVDTAKDETKSRYMDDQLGWQTKYTVNQQYGR